MNSKSFDDLFDAALEEVALEDAEMAESIDTSWVVFSDKFTRQMQELIEASRRSIALSRKKRCVLLIAAIISVLFLTACMGIPKLRKAIFEPVFDFGRKSFRMEYVSTGETSAERPDFVQMAPTYIPEGYKEVKNRCIIGIDTSKSYLEYEKGISYITVDQEYVEEAKYNIDNERSTIGSITVNGYEAVLVTFRDSDSIFIIWNDGTYAYEVYSTSLSLDEAVKIAESISPVA